MSTPAVKMEEDKSKPLSRNDKYMEVVGSLIDIAKIFHMLLARYLKN